MKRSIRACTIVLAATITAGCEQQQAQAPAAPPSQGENWQAIKRLPDFSGVWEPIDPIQPADEYSQNLPLTPEGLETYAAIKAQSAVGKRVETRTDNYEGRTIPCITRGQPGAMLDPETLLEFTFTPGRVTIIDTSGWVRRIWTDGRAHVDLVDSFQGDSIGHWEGKTLVVNTTSIDKNNELFVGIKIGEQAQIDERYTLTNSNTMEVQITLTAPELLTVPYTTTVHFRRHADWQINEYDCYFGNRNHDHTIVR